MKRLLVVAAGTLALMSGAANAGEGGCAYGKHLAQMQEKTPAIAAIDQIEADRLKELKAIDGQAALDTLGEGPVLIN